MEMHCHGRGLRRIGDCWKGVLGAGIRSGVVLRAMADDPIPESWQRVLEGVLAGDARGSSAVSSAQRKQRARRSTRRAGCG